MKKEENIIFFIHGLLRSRISMVFIKRFFKKNGYQTLNYSYRSTKFTIKEHSANLANFIAEFATSHQNTNIHFITHSLGGIILREAIADLKEDTLSSLGRIVMIAPPNKGSDAATRFSKFKFLSNQIKPLSELSKSQGSVIDEIYHPKDIEIGVIAGKYDGKVKVEESHLNEEKDHLIVDAMHTFIMNRSDVMEASLSFIKNGKFTKNEIVE